MGINRINVYYSTLASIRRGGQSHKPTKAIPLSIKFNSSIYIYIYIYIYSLIHGDENISIFEIIKTMKIFKTSEGPTLLPDYKLNS